MKYSRSSRIGCITAVAFFLLIILSSAWYHRYMKKPVASVNEGISWANAAEKCKGKYEAYRSLGEVTAPNCRKRTEDDDFFFFSWSKPLALIVKKPNGQISKISGTCRVAKESGEIVYMTLGKTVLVDNPKK